MKICCVVILSPDNKIVGWKMNKDIRAKDAATMLKAKYFHPYKVSECRIEEAFFEGSDTGGWGLKTDDEAVEWRKQWEIHPAFKELIDKGAAYAPY